MKTQQNILIAFLLNLAFSLFELMGGLLTGSVAILSDAVHDLGDAAGIGVSYYLERLSKRKPDGVYTYGYGRFSVLGSLVTTAILTVGSALVIYGSVLRILNPTPIHYDGMILFAVVGVAVNLCAALVTRHGDSLNQRAVNLHMLEDVLGWLVVLVGAVVMRLTDLAVLDPILSLGVSVFIMINAGKNLLEGLQVFLEKAPAEPSVAEIRSLLMELEGVEDVHHIHLWSMDGQDQYATMHVVTDGEARKVKAAVRAALHLEGIDHVTLELEAVGEYCHNRECKPQPHACRCHHGHHHG